MITAAADVGLFEVMSTCRALRRLKPDPVPDDMVMRLVTAANYAPSGRNMQRARWIIVRTQEQKQRIADLNRRASEESARQHVENPSALPHHDSERRRRMYEAVLWQAEHMHEFPVLIVACCILDTPDQDPNRYAGSIWPGVQNLLLAARALGLGAVPTTYVLRYREELHQVLELPPRVSAQALIPVGFPTGTFGPVRRMPVEEITMHERWHGPLPDTLE